MRTSPQPQLLLISLASTLLYLSIFKALLLNVQQAHADNGSLPSCYTVAHSQPSCSLFKKNVSVFPFLTSSVCGSVSSFALSGCDEKRAMPIWPGFKRAAIPGNSALEPPFVLGLSQISRFVNSSNQSSSPRDPKILNDTQTMGSINLTWSDTLVNQSACTTRASGENISTYLPDSIDLTSFAHASFQFSSSNIFLLFNCTKSPSSISKGFSLEANSTACRSYVSDCKLSKKESQNCYQYTPQGMRELNLSVAMASLGCEYAMFFTAWQSLNISAPLNTNAPLNMSFSRWTAGLIELNWSTINNSWMDTNLKNCQGCRQSNGTCGYDDNDNFLCYCVNNTNSASCTAVNSSNQTVASKVSKSHSTSCKDFPCIGRMIAFAAAGFAIALSLSITAFFIWRKKVFTNSSGPGSSRHHMIKGWMKKPSFLCRKQDPLLAMEMSYDEIEHATESFADKHMLGDGGFGAVYQGVLVDGRKVAVKRLFNDNCRRTEHFFNEIKALSNLNHPNLVKLYGFCYEDEKELLLVFEYARQGTVSDQLHDASKPPMAWKLRLNIACETAEALSYLHNSVEPPIYHRDVKTTNILLDEGFHVKLADFGLSKFVPLKATHVSTAPQGTPGYLDPDYHQCYQLTDKSDVYSLGVVLMELISAKLAVDMSRGRGEINLSTLAIMKIQCGRLEELVDPRLEMKKSPCVERSIKRVVELAFQCLHADREERPLMRVVAEMLANIRSEYEDEEAVALLNLHINTETAPRGCQSCVSSESNKLLHHCEDSPCSVVFSSGSSNQSSG